MRVESEHVKVAERKKRWTGTDEEMRNPNRKSTRRCQVGERERE